MSGEEPKQPQVEQQKQGQVLQLAPGDLTQFEYVSTRWDAKIAQGVSPDQLEAPAFWAHQAMQLRPFDEIRARAEDGTWIAYYVVLDCSRTWAKVKLDRILRVTTADVSITAAQVADAETFIAGHSIVWRSPNLKWCVVRTADKQSIHDGEASKSEAEAWLAKHARQQVTQQAVATIA